MIELDVTQKTQEFTVIKTDSFPKRSKFVYFLLDWPESQEYISCPALEVAHGSVLVGSKSAFEFPHSILCNDILIYFWKVYIHSSSQILIV